jgi:hypothetical protein
MSTPPGAHTRDTRTPGMSVSGSATDSAPAASAAVGRVGVPGVHRGGHPWGFTVLRGTDASASASRVGEQAVVACRGREGVLGRVVTPGRPVTYVAVIGHRRPRSYAARRERPSTHRGTAREYAS